MKILEKNAISLEIVLIIYCIIKPLKEKQLNAELEIISQASENSQESTDRGDKELGRCIPCCENHRTNIHIAYAF